MHHATPMRNAAFTAYFHRELLRIRASEELDAAGRLEARRFLLLRLFEEATKPERLHFTTIYARIAYTGHKYAFPGKLIYHVNRFRNRSRWESLPPEELEKWEQLSETVLLQATELIYGQDIPDELKGAARSGFPFRFDEGAVVAFRDTLRAVAVEDDAARDQLIVRTEEPGAPARRVQYGEAGRGGELLNAAVQIIRTITRLPVQVNLLEVEIHEDGLLHPRDLIIEPDHLIDVSAVSESFQPDGTLPWQYLTKKLLPFTTNVPQLRGNVANYFLDALIQDPELTYRDLKKELFALAPLTFCRLDDREIRDMLGTLQRHYLNLRLVTEQQLGEQDIDRATSQLEPSFYSPTYGLQGRLDLLHRAPAAEDGETPRASIIELKSGKVFRPNKHGLSANHFVQTLCYDLIVRGAYGARSPVANYILYSGAEERQLRFAPRDRFLQHEALAVRNQLYAIERLLASIGTLAPGDDPTDETLLIRQTDRLIDRINPERYPTLKGFLIKDLQRIYGTYRNLNALERAYLGAYLGFTAREHALAKTGRQGSETINGLAGLWLDDPAEKDGRFERLGDLRYDRYEPADGLVHLRRGPRTHDLVKFRRGDIMALYPCEVMEENGYSEPQAALRNQVFKCTLVEIGAESCTIRLRQRQSNDDFFRSFTGWALEKDVLDSGFNTYYRGLWTFAEAPPIRRALWLGLRAPRTYEPADLPAPPGMTAQQADILRSILAAPDYFLLWGPPGTGKTSVMLHHLADHLYHRTEERIMLLAYTNRAVDEICESIERIGGGEFTDYLRIGSRYGTAPAFQERLLRRRTENIETRRELKQLLHGHRIYVGTVSGIAGNPELFELIQFDRIIVDEASQILEPLLSGLLNRAPRVLLIGDHRQLPAVVAQDEETTQVNHGPLREIGVTDLAGSLFERLYRRCRRPGLALGLRHARLPGPDAHRHHGLPQQPLLRGRTRPTSRRHPRPSRPTRPPGPDRPGRRLPLRTPPLLRQIGLPAHPHRRRQHRLQSQPPRGRRTGAARPKATPPLRRHRRPAPAVRHRHHHALPRPDRPYPRPVHRRRPPHRRDHRRHRRTLPGRRTAHHPAQPLH